MQPSTEAVRTTHETPETNRRIIRRPRFTTVYAGLFIYDRIAHILTFINVYAIILSSLMHTNINSHHTSTKEIDPRFLHREGFRKTLDKIKYTQHLAHQALPQQLSHRPSREDFAKFAGTFSRESSDKNEKMYASILATLPGSVRAERVLQSRDDISYNDRHTAVLEKISFNNALRESIENNPRIEKSILLNTVKSAAQFYQYSANEINAVERGTSDSLRGMQHELAFESILWNLPEGFEILETTDEDDARGTDYRVRCPNGTEVSIDVKASEEAAANSYQKRVAALARRGKTVPKNELILYSGFTDEDFDPTYPWRPTYEVTSELTPYVESILLEASGEEVSSQQLIAN